MYEKLGICQWDIPVKGPEGLALAASLGYAAVEMDLGLNDPSSDLRDPKNLAAFLAMKEKTGIQTPTLALNGLPLNSADKYALTCELLDAAVEAAVAIGAKTLQSASFFGNGMRNEEEFMASVAAFQYACDKAAPYGITMGSENQLTTEDNLRLLAAVNRPNFALYYDVANPYVFDGRDAMAMLPVLYPHCCEVHVKDYLLTGDKPCVPLGEGECHVEDALAYMKEQGYDRWIIVENKLDADTLARDARYVQEKMA